MFDFDLGSIDFGLRSASRRDYCLISTCGDFRFDCHSVIIVLIFDFNSGSQQCWGGASFFPQLPVAVISAFARFFDPTNKDFRCAIPQSIVRRSLSAEVFGLSVGRTGVGGKRASTPIPLGAKLKSNQIDNTAESPS